jgi:hypothetical protein
MRCFVATKKGTQCAHNITSGYTFTWYQYMVRTCKQHGEMIHHGTLLLSATTVVYKGEVALTPAHAVCEALELDLHVDDAPTTTHTCAPATTHGVRCGACSTHDAPVYHAHVDDVRACYMHTPCCYPHGYTHHATYYQGHPVWCVPWVPPYHHGREGMLHRQAYRQQVINN